MPHRLHLARLMCARLCQDLVAPIGTVEGALSFAAGGSAEAMAIAREGMAVLRARLALFRAAWGCDAGDATLAELLALLDGQIGGGRAGVEIAGATLPPRTVFPAPLATLLLNALLLAGDALPRGGTVLLDGDPGDVLAVLPRGEGAAWPPGTAAAIGSLGLDDDQPFEARSVRAPMLAALAADLRIPLTLALGGPGGPAPLLIGPVPVTPH